MLWVTIAVAFIAWMAAIDLHAGHLRVISFNGYALTVKPLTVDGHKCCIIYGGQLHFFHARSYGEARRVAANMYRGRNK